MGGGKAGNFGNTFGQKLDMLSDALTAASLIPGVDTIADLAAIPVAALRQDFVSVGLDALGVIPLVGEVADTAKLAKTAGKAVDAAKTANKASKVTSVSDNAKSVAKKYNLGENGYFGTKGKNTRVFQSDDPIKSSADFYEKISKGGKQSALSNGKGVQAVFDDGSREVYRVKTSTPNSPAIDIGISVYSGIKKQKIHFIK